MKTPLILLAFYLLTFCSLSHSDLDTAIIAQTEKGFEASKEFVTKLAQLGEKLAAQERLNKVKAALQLISKVDKLLPLIGFTAPLVSFALAFVDQESAELRYMKQKFAEVNNNLASISNQIKFLERNIDWAAYASNYAADQNNIVNSWEKLTEFMQSIRSGMSAEDRVRLADQFLTFYETTATENSVANLYRYVTERNPFSLNKNLLTLIIEKTSGDLGALKDYSQHLSMLMVTGLRLNLYYYQTKKHSNTAFKVKDTIKKLSNFQRALQDAVEECANGYKKWAEEDAKRVIAENPSSDDETLAKNIKTKLNEKFDWFVWSVIVHDKTGSCSGKGRSIDFDHGSKRIHLIAQAEGVVTPASWPPNTMCSDIPKIEGVQYIHDGEFVGGQKFDCVDYYVNPMGPGGGRSYPRLKTMSAVWTAKPRTPSCYMCENGQCVQMQDSNEYFCKCEAMYHGTTCKDYVDDTINFSVIQKNIYDVLSKQIVPDMASVYFKLQKMEENLKDINNRLQKCNI